MSVQIINADVFAGLARLEDESVHCCVTSPPYWGLRDYGVEGQIGLEPTPEEFVEKMVAVFREVKRVLHKDGTLWLNLGDSYNNTDKWGGGGPGKNGKQTLAPDGSVPSWAVRRRREAIPNIKPKDLVGIPWMTAFALRADGWFLRQEIIWSKPNAMPESVRDRCTKAHEHIFLLSSSSKYFYDAEAIRESALTDDIRRPYAPGQVDARGNGHDRGGGTLRNIGSKGNAKTFRGGVYTKGSSFDNSATVERDSHGNAPNPALSRNKRSVWTIATEGYAEAHFATFPEELPETCIKAGCPIGGTVLDPFGGAGTTGLVADKLGRNAVLIELNPEYAAMAERRIRGSAPLFAQVVSSKPEGTEQITLV